MQVRTNEARVTARQIIFAFLAVMAVAGVANADEYPNRPIHIIVPFPPGGGIDVAMRIIGQELSNDLGQPVIVDNRSGAGGMVGTEAGAKAAPDGYTLTACTPGPTSIGPALHSKLPYNPVTDFEPVSMVAIGGKHTCCEPGFVGQIGGRLNFTQQI